MASSEYGVPEEPEVALEDADVYKGTSNSDYVVIRRVRLYRSKFITYHNIEENPEDNKQWILTSQCDLVPRTFADIKEAVNKYVRPRGQWAITTLVKPKSLGTPGQLVRLYMFTLSWPTRWAAKGYTSFSFGFESLDEARHWHSRLGECLSTLRTEKAMAAATGSTPQTGSIATTSFHPHRLSLGTVPGGASNGGGGGTAGGAFTTISAGPLQGTASMPSSSTGVAATAALSKSSTPVHVQTFAEGRASAGQVPNAQITSSGTSPEEHGRGAAAAPSPPGSSHGAVSSSAPTSSVTRGSSFAVATAAAAKAAAGLPATGAAATTTKALLSRGTAATAAAPPPAQPPPPPPSSTDSEGNFEELEEAIMSGHSTLGHHGHPRGSTGALSGAGPPCRQPRGTLRGDVHHSKQRWVPYKQVNGVAIYYRPQTAGDAEAGVGGEFMVSTVVRGSPRRCVTALTSHCGTTTILGPAISQEVLQRRRAIDEKEVLRIVIQAPGLAGAICAPRELVVETVFKTDETGPTLVLMFNSCEPPARFVESKTAEQQDSGAVAEDLESVESSSEGGSRSWWRRPVLARVRGGYTMAPLEDNSSLDTSPEALVTCIMKVDLGGVCGERSWLRLVSNLAGWTDAFVDRMLMAVTLLRDEVEQSRFVVQPLSMMASSSRLKERERESLGVGSAVDLSALGGAARSMESAVLTAAAAAGAAGGLRRLRQGTLQRSTVARAKSRMEGERPSLVDGPAAEHSAGGAAVASGAEAGSEAVGAPAADEDAAKAGSVPGAAHSEAEGAAARAAEAGPGAGPPPGGYETLDDVLARMKSLSFLDTSVWDNLHQPGKDAPFKIRGPTYLKDRKKIPAGYSRFVLGSMDVIQQPPGVMHEHVARFIPAIRESGAPFMVVVHLVIPGTPLLGIVATFVTDRHPSTLGTPPASPMEDEHDWEPFDLCLHKYMTGSNYVRNHMLKLIPHIADGSWMIKQSVGTTPVILGKQLRTIYYETPQYIEIDIDISANNVASYVTGLVRGATRSLVIDMGFVLEGTTPWELPEALLGTLRLYHLDIKTAKLIDTSREIPLRRPNMAPPPPLKGHPYTVGIPDSAQEAPATAVAASGSAAAAAMPSLVSLGRVSASGGGTAAAAHVSSGSPAPAAGQAGGKLPTEGSAAPAGGATPAAGGLARRTSGLPGSEGVPVVTATSPAADNPSSPSSGNLRPPSAVQTPQPLRGAPAASPSNSGAAASPDAAAAATEEPSPPRS